MQHQLYTTITTVLLMVALSGCATLFSPPKRDYNQLHIGTRLNLQQNVTTVEQAVNWLLQPTSYSVVARTPEARMILSEPLSPLAQKPEFMTIEEALLMVIGANNRLVVDHDNDLITFEVYRASIL